MFLVAAVPRGARDATAGSEVITIVGRLISQKLSDGATLQHLSDAHDQFKGMPCPSCV
jgi:hypothetical protein